MASKVPHKSLVYQSIASVYFERQNGNTYPKLYPKGMKKAEDRSIYASKRTLRIIDEEFAVIVKKKYDAYRKANPISLTQ